MHFFMSSDGKISNKIMFTSQFFLPQVAVQHRRDEINTLSMLGAFTYRRSQSCRDFCGMYWLFTLYRAASPRNMPQPATGLQRTFTTFAADIDMWCRTAPYLSCVALMCHAVCE